MYILNFHQPSARINFTSNPEDFPPHRGAIGKTCLFFLALRQAYLGQTGIYIFWRPHLEKLVDLNDKRRRLDAGATLVPFLRRLQIRQICARVRASPRVHESRIIFFARQNEIKRASEKSKATQEYIEPLDLFEKMRERDRFLNFTDVLPEPWETRETSLYNRILKKNFLLR